MEQLLSYLWGGVQTRPVTCVREHAPDAHNGSNSVNVEDTFCTRNGLSKPATSQNCNTQSCTECKYDVTNFSDNGGCTNSSAIITYAWFTTATTGLFEYSAAEIYWNGTKFPEGNNFLDISATSATINGYLYTRSTQKDTCYSGGVIPPNDYISTYETVYEVCRESV